MDKYTVRVGGVVDIAASANSYARALSEWVAKNEIDLSTLESAVNTVLDRYPNKRIPTPAFISYVINELGGKPEQYNVLAQRIHDYMKEQKSVGALEVVKGTGGGVSRVLAKTA
jgi:hypothetical protein